MRFIVIILIATLAACSTPAADLTLEKRVDAIFGAHAVGQKPGYSVGIIRGGEFLLAKGYGFADIQKAQQITPDTAFNLASLSKQFTAATVALEIEKGEIQVDDPLVKHWPELPDFMQDITIAHLLYMTSGLKEYYTLPSPKGGWSSEDQFTVDDSVNAVLASSKLEYEPGTRWTYSNINYQLLAVLVARINGHSFPDHMDRTIFEPLQMKHSWVDAPIDKTREYRAKSYIRDDKTGRWRIAPRLSPHFGGSGVFASLNDLAKWDHALYRSQALGATFKQVMLSTHRFKHDKQNDAFGLVHGSYHGHKIIWYEGRDYGVSTYMAHLPEREETVICLSNFVMDLLFAENSG